MTSLSKKPTPVPAKATPGFRLTREGWLWLLLTVFLVIVGWFKGVNLVLLLGYAMLAVISLNLVLVRWRLRALHGGRRRRGELLFAGSPFAIEVTVTSTSRRGKMAIVMEDRGGQHALHWFLPHIGAQETIQRVAEVTLRRRGVYSWPAAQVVSSYPFGLAQARQTLGSAENVLVLPCLGRVHRGRLRRYLRQHAPERDRPRPLARRHPSAQIEFHALRPFMTGDSPRLIHWRTSARRGELMVREFEETPSDHLILAVDLYLPRYLRTVPGVGVQEDPGRTFEARRRLERTISIAATIVWEWCRQTGDHLVLVLGGTPDGVFSGATGRPLALRMLEQLAMVTGDAPTNPEELMERLARTELPVAPVLVLTAQATRNEAGLPDSLAERLTASLRRPVACIDCDDRAVADFFEAPAVLE